MLKTCRYSIKASALLIGVLALSGCLEDISPFSQNTDYSINGIQDDQDTKDYLNKILRERLVEDIDYDEDSEEFRRAAAAREETIAADLKKALKAKGYYDAEIEFVDNENEDLQGSYEIYTGPQYTISSITIEPENMAKNFDASIIKTGDVLEAQPVLDAQSKLYENIQKDKCYFSLDVQHAVILDEDNKTGQLIYTADIGPSATFGPAIFEGQSSVELSYLNKLITWKKGDCFRQEKIRSLITKLLETGLFVRAESKLPEAPDQDGTVPVTIQLKERDHRSVKAGVSYYTDEGAGITLGWEHRNILGSGEKLEAELNVSQINQSLDLDFTKPFFIRKDQSLEINGALRQQDTDAYEEKALDFGGSIKRQFNKRLSGNTGAQFTFSEITDEDGTDTYGLLSFPNALTFDNRDNPLDPHKGWHLKASIEPFYDMLGESDPFTKIEAGARTYFNLIEDPDLVLALRANIGSIVGASTANVPATERFYAGGGGSIRGFGYQEVGPFDDDGDPSGGRSLLTGSTELRLKFTDTIGGVAFVDAGSVSEESTINTDNLSVGAGVGIRYYTNFGPLRFDIATPLNQKDNLDQNYQFYISIGQAF